jgi:hypothetical protein
MSASLPGRFTLVEIALRYPLDRRLGMPQSFRRGAISVISAGNRTPVSRCANGYPVCVNELNFIAS